MEITRREKLISRLKKCLALSASPEPHEAAAALRHAQKLMAELDMTEEDLLGLEIQDVTVKTREGFGACRTMNYLATIIVDAFGVECFFERNPGTAKRLNVRYVGQRDRVLLAEYSHRVIWRAMQGQWDAFLAERSWLKGASGKRQAFQLGWLSMVQAKVEKLTPPEDETRAVKSWIAKKFGELTEGGPIRQTPVSADAFYAGREAGSEFNLHAPVESKPLAIGCA